MTRALRVLCLLLFAAWLSPLPSGLALAAAGGGAAGCPPAWNVVASPNVGLGDNVLNAIAAIQPEDVWAVGRDDAGSLYDTLTEHWDGSSWTVIPSPNGAGGSTSNFLEDVAGAAPGDVWAVGEYGDPSLPRQDALALHWDGTAWSVVPTPHVGSNSNELHAVSAVSSDDVWAVGESITSKGLAMHWDGTAWSVVPTPSMGTFSAFSGVAAVASDDVWVVGASDVGFFLHWDGIGWTEVPAPEEMALSHIAADGPSDIWAVGSRTGATGYRRTLTEHWDGSSWSIVPSPNLGMLDNDLYGVAVDSPDDAWAVGTSYDLTTASDQTLALHWDGTRWSVVSAFVIGGLTTVLEDVAIDPMHQVWTAGFGPTQARSLVERVCPSVVSDAGFFMPSVSLRHAPGVVWRFDPTNVQEHSVTDGTGLGLFDSGPRPAGSTFSFSFFASGSYDVVDTPGSNESTVDIPVHLWPRRGALGQRFHVQWAPMRLPARFVVDVQIRRPGSPGFVDWLTAQTARGAAFVPDAGPGTYAFRARLRSALTGASSAYSVGATILVGSASLSGMVAKGSGPLLE